MLMQQQLHDVQTCGFESVQSYQVRVNARLFKAMIDDPSRGWIGKPQSPAEYANGTRLFAYRALRGQLTCPQLGTALNEVAVTANTYRAPVQGVSAAQAKRVLALNTDVERELRAEIAARCKG